MKTIKFEALLSPRSLMKWCVVAANNNIVAAGLTKSEAKHLAALLNNAAGMLEALKAIAASSPGPAMFYLLADARAIIDKINLEAK